MNLGSQFEEALEVVQGPLLNGRERSVRFYPYRDHRSISFRFTGDEGGKSFMRDEFEDIRARRISSREMWEEEGREVKCRGGSVGPDEMLGC